MHSSRNEHFFFVELNTAKTAKDSAEKVQKTESTVITGAIRTTSSVALNTLLSLTLLPFAVRETALVTYPRMLFNGSWKSHSI